MLNDIEIQQYIYISPYHDTLGSDTISIHILGHIDISSIMYRHQSVYCTLWL